MTHPDPYPHTLASAIDHAFANPDHPTTRLLALNSSGNRFEIELRFLAALTYCCPEPGCHIPASDQRWWRTLRDEIRQHINRDPPPMTITIHTVVEPAARFEIHKALAIPLESRGDLYDPITIHEPHPT